MQTKYSVTTLDDFFWALYIVPERLRPLARAFKDQTVRIAYIGSKKKIVTEIEEYDLCLDSPVKYKNTKENQHGEREQVRNVEDQ